MLSIDRHAPTPVQAQILEQLRFEIATGRLRIGDRLPSTRGLARQLDVSYHTVRSAYRKLEEEGLVAGRSGSEYRVVERAPVVRTDRMEAGAAVVQEALRRLVGLGLDLEEVEYLFQEQMDLAAVEADQRKLLFIGPALELATLCAHQLSEALRQPVDAATLGDVVQHGDADFLFASFEHVQSVMARAPRADVRGVVVDLNHEALEKIVRLLPEETLGVVTRTDAAVAPLVQKIRGEAGFAGQMLAFSSDTGHDDVTRLIDQASLVVYTPAARRSLLPYLKTQTRHEIVQPLISRPSLEQLRQVVPA